MVKTQFTMSEREFPSVPVTTLAGLTSLSDCKLSIKFCHLKIVIRAFHLFLIVLSELPVSESLGNTSLSLSRTLLFHTLVASESKNLLSIRDDNLTKQLIQAIEKTNPESM